MIHGERDEISLAIVSMPQNHSFGRTKMTDKKSSEKTEAQIMEVWMAAVGGSISLGESLLKSVEVSKNGDKLTVVLRKLKKDKAGA